MFGLNLLLELSLVSEEPTSHLRENKPLKCTWFYHFVAEGKRNREMRVSLSPSVLSLTLMPAWSFLKHEFDHVVSLPKNAYCFFNIPYKGFYTLQPALASSLNTNPWLRNSTFPDNGEKSYFLMGKKRDYFCTNLIFFNYAMLLDASMLYLLTLSLIGMPCPHLPS